MITIILEDDKNKELERIGEVDNRQYLLAQTDSRKYPILSELSDSDYEIILSENIPQLISELKVLKNELTLEKQATHINEIIHLAQKCQGKSGFAIIFTPFAHLT
jgi:hypothetical protein